MNLRSGVTTQSLKTKPKRTKKDHVTNKCTMDVSNLETSLKKMLTDFKEDLTKQIGEMHTDIGKISSETTRIRQDLKDIRQSLGEAQSHIEEAEQRIHQLEERECDTLHMLKQLSKDQKEMAEKLEYLENKSRQFNIRIYGVKEGLEGEDAIGFITSLLAEKLEIAPEIIQIAAAHRSLGPKPTREDAAPRSLVVRFAQWNTRQKILRAAWNKKEITIEERRIYLSPDFSNKIHKERSRLFQLRKLLKQKNVNSHIIYPSRLKVFMEGNTTTYDSFEEAQSSLRDLGLLEGGDYAVRDTSVNAGSFEKVKTARHSQQSGAAPRSSSDIRPKK
ncbi:hypothetical protein WMY93_017828 [Mugilogobius chulae]|uniref:L1 transposable element RRM domain-containing protein n=1 Tax=Mugilogobius chulae TaxID=88201 RepID=A0AAW0NPU4_9GOBI